MASKRLITRYLLVVIKCYKDYSPADRRIGWSNNNYQDIV